jgi:hypothetical protein
MLRIDGVSRKLQCLLGGAVASTQADVVVCFKDYPSQQPREFLRGTQVSTTNNATAVDICAAPLNATTREVDHLSIHNNDTAAIAVTVRYNDNGTTYKLQAVTLGVGETLCFATAVGWYVIDANGRRKDAVPSAWTAKVLTVSGLVKTGRGTAYMVKVSSSTSGTIKLWDNTSAAGTVIQDTMSVSQKEEHFIPADFSTGLYVTIAGTATITVYYA